MTEEKGDCSCNERACEKEVNLEEEVNEIRLLTTRVAELEEKLVRNQAEVANYKRRKEEETSRLIKYGNEDLIISLLPVLDNFERAFKMDDDDLTDEVSKFLEGIKMVYANLRNVLEACEVKEIECLGKEFNPNLSEAVMTEDSKKDNIVLEVYQKGYIYQEKLIRPAMVKVGKDKENE